MLSFKKWHSPILLGSVQPISILFIQTQLESTTQHKGAHLGFIYFGQNTTRIGEGGFVNYIIWFTCNISYTSSQMFAMLNNILEDKYITDLNLIRPMHLMSGVNGVLMLSK